MPDDSELIQKLETFRECLKSHQTEGFSPSELAADLSDFTRVQRGRGLSHQSTGKSAARPRHECPKHQTVKRQFLNDFMVPPRRGGSQIYPDFTRIPFRK
jgi:hypothetical protein